MGWNSLGMEFICEGGRAELNQLKWDVQNYQNYDQEYKASTHLLLAYCQMAFRDPHSLNLSNAVVIALHETY